MKTKFDRRYPVGAEVVEGGAHFRVWAPSHRKVEVVVEPDNRAVELDAERDGYFSGFVDGIGAGTLYRFRLGTDEKLYPDPASRFQPDGPHGPSEIIDASRWNWSDGDWKGVTDAVQVVYELHVGTFTPEGTYAAAMQKFPLLIDAGVTMVELMPLADFSGSFGWGYDGVDLFAPSRLYGRPDDLRRLVDEAHRLGLAVILDVVYNHLGPDGNYIAQFSKHYFTDRYENEWGDALNFDGPRSSAVRELFVSNARYWIDEFHFDGLRLDATQSIHDSTERHLLGEVTLAAHAAAKGRRIWTVAENERQLVRTIRPREEGGYGVDAMWNDDFHHAARVALTGQREAYYTDYFGRAQEFVSMIRHGFLFQGQRYSWQKQRRGTSSRGVPGRKFVWYIQNHDQVANTASGERIQKLAAPAPVRAVTALVFLGPATPMLFQGQEWGASTPFTYFADHEPELAAQVEKGRREFLLQFPSLANEEMQQRVPSPSSREVFERCRLDWSERERNSEWLQLHRDLALLRRNDPVFSRAGIATTDLDAAVLSESAFALRYFSEAEGDRLVVINLGSLLAPEILAEPLLAAPEGGGWELIWSSESPQYGGGGSGTVLSDDDRWRFPPRSAVVLKAVSKHGK